MHREITLRESRAHRCRLAVRRALANQPAEEFRHEHGTVGYQRRHDVREQQVAKIVAVEGAEDDGAGFVRHADNLEQLGLTPFVVPVLLKHRRSAVDADDLGR